MSDLEKYFIELKNVDEDIVDKKEVHLKDILKNKKITAFYVFNDIRDAHFVVYENLQEDEDGDDIVSQEIEMLSWSDDKLKKLSLEDVQKITNVELLDKIASLDKDKLSINQINTLKELYKEKVIIDKKDVEYLLKKFNNASKLIIAQRPKNDSFLEKYDLYIDDCLEIIKQLKVEDYYRSSRDFNLEHFGHNVIIFEPKNITLSSGKQLGDITLYIKIDVSESSDDMIVDISFHQTNKANNLPFKQENEEDGTQENK